MELNKILRSANFILQIEKNLSILKYNSQLQIRNPQF